MSTRHHFSQEQKHAVLESAKEIGVEEASRLSGVHPSTIYEWRQKLEALGKEAFLSYKRKSRGRGVKKITIEQEKAVLETWEKNKGYGPSQVRNQLRRQGKSISTRTVERIMIANGYKGPRKKRKQENGLRYEASRPLELAQMDILEFYVNKSKLYLILLLDDYSRFILGWSLLTETSIDAVILVVHKAIERYGKMEEILTDRGFVFYSWRGINRFEKYLENEGIHHTHARPHHPQTLGKVEAANKQVQKELISREHFASISECETGLNTWVETYNYKRTHQGLGGLLVPADRFHGKEAEVVKAISEKIDPSGDICYKIEGITRNLIKLELGADGELKLYLLGRPIKLIGGYNELTIESE